MLTKINTIVFDQAGTLTYGNLKISKIINYSDIKEGDIIETYKMEAVKR